MAVRVSYGSRANMDPEHARKSGPRAPCTTLDELQEALKDDIEGGTESVIPECTTAELSLGSSALIPLHRPIIGPYADGGEHDLPPEFKTSWTDISDDPAANTAYAKKSHPQATVEAIVNVQDAHTRQIVQRAASRAIVAAIEGTDGFKYNFNNAWAAKDESGQRFSYICQDSMQNKDRHANGFTRTQKHLKGEGERGARKPTYDCKGSVSVKCSLHRKCIDVYYRHYAIHPTLEERKTMPRVPGPRLGLDPIRAQPPMYFGRTAQNEEKVADTGGLFGRLQAEKSAYVPPPNTQVTPVTGRQEASNIGKPLKRKRDSEYTVPSSEPGKPLSLVELLRQSESAGSPSARSVSTPKSASNRHPPPVTYDLPSWQTPPPVPVNRQTKPPQYGTQYGAPYPPPYQPTQHPQTPSQPPKPAASRLQQVPPRQEYFGSAPTQPHPQGQGLFATLKPVQPDPPAQWTVYSQRAGNSCTNCRYGKKQVSQP